MKKISCLPVRKYLLGGFLLWQIMGWSAAVQAETWQEVRGAHFVIHYGPKADRKIAKTLLRKAEDYYRTIGARIGYTRYANFWTWDERVRIILFPDQQSFVTTTGQPVWSTGYADRDSHLFHSRSIVTYKQEHEFSDGLLPHEISHLILHDFISSSVNIPIWFDEGVAQIQEPHKSEVAHYIMQRLIQKGQYLRFNGFLNHDIRKETDPKRVKIFYAQSLSIVEFLIKTYGSDAFGKLCRGLRDGKTFEEALRRAYTNSIGSITDLENKWVRYMMK